MDDAPNLVDDAEAGAARTCSLPEEMKHRTITLQPAADTEIGGPKGPEPTRYGDWERKGRCIDF